MKKNQIEGIGITSSGQQHGRQNQNRGQAEGSGSLKRMSYTESEEENKNTGNARKEKASRTGGHNSKRESTCDKKNLRAADRKYSVKFCEVNLSQLSFCFKLERAEHLFLILKS